MKKQNQKLTLILILIFLVSQKVLGDTHYVNVNNPMPSAPYTSWTNAANTIQDAVDATDSWDDVLVTNGVYATGRRITPGHSLSNRVVITKNITVASVNGPENTVILGKGPLGDDAVRCVYITTGTLSGFTISNGHTQTTGNYDYNRSGGGVWMTTGCILTNCIISGNGAYTGGGMFCYYGGSISDCSISGNSADYGGGVNCNHGGTLNNCTISGNSAADYGGAAYCWNGGAVNNCTISGNSAAGYGGAVYCSSGAELNNCTISGNNSADDGGGVYCSLGGAVNNCTISGNTAANHAGGVHCYFGGALTNTIIYFNIASSGDNWYNQIGFGTGSYAFCCTTPTNGLPGGEGCIEDNPLFVNTNAANYRLLSASPCIDSGTNLPWMTVAKDLDGNPRIYDGIVDMGAYEYIPEPVGIWIIGLILPFKKWNIPVLHRE